MLPPSSEQHLPSVLTPLHATPSLQRSSPTRRPRYAARTMGPTSLRLSLSSRGSTPTSTHPYPISQRDSPSLHQGETLSPIYSRSKLRLPSYVPTCSLPITSAYSLARVSVWRATPFFKCWPETSPFCAHTLNQPPPLYPLPGRRITHSGASLRPSRPTGRGWRTSSTLSLPRSFTTPLLICALTSYPCTRRQMTRSAAVQHPSLPPTHTPAWPRPSLCRPHSVLLTCSCRIMPRPPRRTCLFHTLSFMRRHLSLVRYSQPLED
jgi:hypothetical protein